MPTTVLVLGLAAIYLVSSGRALRALSELVKK